MTRLFVACILFLALGINTLGQEPKKQPPPKDRPKDAPTEMAPAVAAMLERLDRNKDGKISKEEAASSQRIKDGFDRIDQNKDGFIDKSELQTVSRMLSGPPGGGSGMRPGGGFGRPDPLDFDALDKNADGRLTKEELRGTRFSDQFDGIDVDKSGKIDPREWSSFHKKK